MVFREKALLNFIIFIYSTNRIRFPFSETGFDRSIGDDSFF
ncbi:hypothetical protein LEP1GSC133_0141 [Leptospira borgpetersenii serovar Pomona str. 200901868]|uniref:Uncharacterized protein n=1 Tax=Leptospira borgpetersenii serovar Pomona str. 200901868 TaxID=1192866 RepID=M6WEN7_LEPBO|nr:hypothetical protein LEP1GSC133_0141 [Leptospira borgpetersenii serovar Pomona str. 200901868]